jgi:signal peptidase II
MSDDAPSPASGGNDEAPAPPPAVEPARVEVAAAPPERGPGYVFLGVVTVLTLAADLGSKWWAKSRLLEGKLFSERRIEVIENWFAFSFAKNKGGAWGILQNEPEVVRRYFFLGISILAVVFIVSLYRRLTPGQTALKWGLPLVLGGALGNLVNRIQYNYVVDFIDFYYVGKDGNDHHWPTFNVADIAIVVGVGLMAVDMFTTRKPKETLAAGAPFSKSVPVVPVEPPGDAAPPPASGEPPPERTGAEDAKA